MTYSISLNNFKKVAAIATFIATATCLVPDSAQAIRISGDPNGNPVIFTLNPLVPDSTIEKDGTDNAPSQGIFPDAITEAIYIYKYQSNSNIPVADAAIKIPLKLANIESSLTTLEDLKKPGNECFGAELCDGKNPFVNGVKYEATLVPIMQTFRPDNGDEFKSVKIQLFIPVFQEKNEYINSLSYFLEPSRISTVRGVINADGVDDPVQFEVIPEPGATVSLLGFGLIGAVSLLKRNRRSRKLASSGLTISSKY